MSTIWDEILARRNIHEEPQNPSFEIEGISRLTLFELSKRNIAVEVRSEILGCKIWLCSNQEMAKQVKTDDPEGVTYTVDELRHLLTLKVSPEELKRIHNAKEVFVDSKIVDSKLKNKS